MYYTIKYVLWRILYYQRIIVKKQNKKQTRKNQHNFPLFFFSLQFHIPAPFKKIAQFFEVVSSKPQKFLKKNIKKSPEENYIHHDGLEFFFVFSSHSCLFCYTLSHLPYVQPQETTPHLLITYVVTCFCLF